MAQEATNTKKGLSDRDALQIFQASHNDVNSSLAVDGFLVGKVGRKVNLALATTTIANDTETYTFSENGTNLYSIRLIYTDGTRATLISAERIS